MPEEKNLLLRGALFYALRMKLPVMPAKPRAKQPLTAHGSLDATTDESQIRAWWKKCPRANVAIRTGTKIFALDVDPAKGGEDSFDTLKLQHGGVRDTLRQVTGGGGFQLIYQNPPGEPIANGESVCGWKGIDVRGVNGYIIAPPSVHPSGKEYFWDTAKKTILEEPIQPADDWLINAIRSAQNGHQHAGFRMPEKIPHGQQHKFLVSLAGKLRAAYCEYPEIVETLWQVNLTRCEKPGPRAHIEQYARSVCNYPPGPAHRDAPTTEPPPPYAAPVDLNQLDASLDLLNSLAVWQGRIRIASVKRRGPMVIATTDAKTEIVWPTTADLGSFSKSQAVVSDATGIWIPTPPHRQIRSHWEPAVHLLLQLSAKDGIRLESPLKEEVRDLLRLMWHAAGQPAAKDGGQFIDYVRAVQKARRNPMGTVPPCVFVAEESAWVHVPSLRAWLSIPALTNKLYPLADIRNGLLLLGFAYFENLSRGFEGDSETACLWRGPLDALEPN